jgi:uncharacterized protein (DUF1697 family)
VKFVVLLRGVNVGGNNRLPMTEFRSALADDGNFREIKTLLASGNLILSSDLSAEKIREKVADIICENFGFDAEMLILSRDDFLDIFAKIPEEIENNSRTRADIFFLFDGANFAKISKESGELSDYEKLVDLGRAVGWFADKKFYKKWKLPRVIGSEVYKKITIRNVNTVRKIAKILLAENNEK